MTTITVHNPNGTAEIPEISGVPEELNWNDTLHITIGDAPGADWYDVRIRWRDDWNERYFEHMDGPGTIDISTYDLDPGK